MTEPASIRYKNPGAMWGSALAVKWGAAKKAVTLKDGKGQGNNIAVFPTYVQGICAQLDLWRTSKNYRNKKFADAIAVWSGHNNVESYIRYVLKRVPGMTRDTVLNDEFWQGPNGIAFLKAQAAHEAGKKYPAPDDDWVRAQRIVFENAPAKPAADKTTIGTRAAAGTAVGTAVVGKITEAVVGPAEQIKEAVTTAGDVVSITKEIASTPKPGFWNGLLALVTSPAFLIGVIVAIAAAWLFVVLWQRRQAAQ